MKMFGFEDCVSYNMDKVIVIRKSAILKHKDITRYYRYIFNECDTNKDGRISITELREFLVKNEGDIPDQVIKCVHRCFDKDSDDQLDFHEFLDLINNPTVMEAFKRIRSRYLKLVAESSVRKKSLKLRRTLTNTGLYEEEATFNYCTISMLVLSLLQVICFYADYDLGCDHPIIRQLTEFQPYQRYQIWRYFTYVLNHGDEAHLYGNVVLQLLLGIPLEMVHTWRVPLIYFAGALGGSLLQGAVIQDASLIGGSPALYSFYSAHIATVIMNWREMSHPFVHFIIFSILVAFDAVRNFLLHEYDEEVSYISHLGGVIVGLPMGVIVLRNLKVTRIESIVWYVSVVVLCVLLVVFVAIHIYFDLMVD